MGYHVELGEICDVNQTQVFLHVNLALCLKDAPCEIFDIFEYLIPLINIPLTMARTSSSIILLILQSNTSLNITMNASEACSICDRQPEDLLVLLCDHNLCVNCATEIYHLNHQANPFVCEICLTETPLDHQTIAHFQQSEQTQRPSTGAQEKGKKNKPPKPNREHNKKYKENPHFEVEDEPVYARTSSKQVNRPETQCVTHSEPALYYCFDCQAADICSECILTAKHANHKVSTFKKAAIYFEKQVEEQVREKESLFSELANEKSKYQTTKRHLASQTQKYKDQVKQIFDGFARAISDQYSSCCAMIDSETRNIDLVLDGCLAEIEDKLRILSQAISMEKRIGRDWKDGSNIGYLQNRPNVQMYMPRLPKEIPVLDVVIVCPQSAHNTLLSILSQVVVQSEKSGPEASRREEEEYCGRREEYCESEESLNEESVIRPEYGRTVLKESHMRSIVNRGSTSSKMDGSRKLQLSRCLDNATNIINKLQERSRRT